MLTEKGGTLPPLLQSLKFGIAPIFGSGKQYYSWIHIQDLCRMYLYAIEKKNLKNVYNGVAPCPEQYRELINAIARVKNKIKINIPVPLSLLKIFLGEFSETLGTSIRCSSKKIEDAGFQFRYRELKEALTDLI